MAVRGVSPVRLETRRHTKRLARRKGGGTGPELTLKQVLLKLDRPESAEILDPEMVR